MQPDSHANTTRRAAAPVALSLIALLLLALSLGACSEETKAPPPPSPAQKPDPQADFLKQRLEKQQRTTAKNDGERMGYYLHGQSKELVLALKARAEPEPTEEENKGTNPVARGPRRPGIKAVEKDAPTGTIDTGQLGSVFRARQNSLQNCYERALKRNPDLRGKVKLMITIRPDGKVGNIGVGADTLRDGSVLTCMKSRVKTWVFPKPEGGNVTVAKTFVFAPQG